MTLFDLIRDKLVGATVKGYEVIDVKDWAAEVDYSDHPCKFPDEVYLDVVVKVPDKRCSKGWRRKSINVSLEESI